MSRLSSRFLLAALAALFLAVPAAAQRQNGRTQNLRPPTPPRTNPDRLSVPGEKRSEYLRKTHALLREDAQRLCELAGTLREEAHKHRGTRLTPAEIDRVEKLESQAKTFRALLEQTGEQFLSVETLRQADWMENEADALKIGRAHV